MRTIGLGVFLCFLWMLPVHGFAKEPLKTVQAHVNSVLNVLGDGSQNAAAAQEKKKEKLRSISEDMFNFIELSKRTLSRNWKKLTPDQRKEFVSLYKKILEKAYMDKLLSYSNEKVVFDKQIMFAKDKAEVQSTIVSKSKTIPIYYRMILRNGQWKVYDLIIEGVSLVKNYRSQFRQILLNKSPEEMLQTLREKVNTL